MKPRVFLPAVLSGVLLWTAFFPLDLGPVGFVALVPWLALVRAPVSNRRRYLAAYLGGVAFFVPALNWLRVAHPMMYFSWAGLALVCPLFWVAGLWLVRRLDRLPGVSLAVSVPVAWVALEYARAHFPTGFPFLEHVGLYQMVGFGWYFLGYTQHAFVPLVQVADVGGVYAVSALVAAVNGVVAEWWMATRGPSGGTAKPPYASTGVVALTLVGALGYGYYRLDHPPFAEGPRVAALQGSMPQSEKNLRGGSLWGMYASLHVRALAASPRPDLIVWPETCMPIDWAEVAGDGPPAGSDPEFARDLDTAGHYFGTTDLRATDPAWRVPKPDWKANTLFGLNGLVWEGGRKWKYNSALLVRPGGGVGGRYDKMHLVPFGEYVPFKETMPWMATFTPYTDDYSCRPGESWTRFRLPAADGKVYSFGCLICYEDSDPYLARQYAAADPVDFLVNISNDGWFDGTEEHEEHLAICRFRAVEARKPIVRAVNMGISAVIDGDGRVVALPAETWSGSKKVEAVVTAAVPLDGRGSWYAALGDWLPATCWGLVAVGLVAGRRRAA